MLATPSLLFQSSPASTTKRFPHLSSRLALADSTNVSPRLDACGLDRSKSLVYPTSSARSSCGWSDVESSIGFTSTPMHSRHHHFASSPSPFQVTYKAPPTVSISLSAACSQSILGEQSSRSRAQGWGPDLPDVKSVVPFPSTPLDGDMDVEMDDETCAPCPDSPRSSASQAPRKRRSAHSSVSSSQGILGKDAKQKRPRKSKRQVAELWWLGVIHRSILRGIEARQSAKGIDTYDGLLSGPRELDALDRVLVENIRKRLAENGCVEGRLPSPLPRISSPSISVPSVNLLAPSGELNPKESDTLGRAVAAPPPSRALPCASLSSISYSLVPSSTPTSRRRHVRFEIAQRPCRPPSHPSIPRRSPSPPPRTGTIPTNAPSLTLTMPQLVASLTLAYHERSRSPMRGRTCKPVGCEKDAGRSLPSSYRVMRCVDDDVTQDGQLGMRQSPTTLRARLSSAPERKSPLSRVAYAEC